MGTVTPTPLEGQAPVVTRAKTAIENYFLPRGFKRETLYEDLSRIGYEIHAAHTDARTLFPGSNRPKSYQKLLITWPHWHPMTRKRNGLLGGVFLNTEPGICPWTKAPRSNDKVNPKGTAPGLSFSPTADWTKLEHGQRIYIHESTIKAENGCRLGKHGIGQNGIRGYSNGDGGLHSDFALLPWKDKALVPVIIFDSPSPVNEASRDDVMAAMQKVLDLLHDAFGVVGGYILLPPPPAEFKSGKNKSWGFDDYCAHHGNEAALEVLDAELVAPPPDDLDGVHPCTDLANAKRLQKELAGDIAFTGAHGWLVWNGKVWEAGKRVIHKRALILHRLISAEVAEVAAQAAACTNDEIRKGLETKVSKLAAWAVTSSMAAKIRAAIEILEPLVDVDPGKFDVQPMLLNCVNGTVDLETGVMRPHRKADYLTVIAPVQYVPEARCPLWDRTLLQIFSGNVELVDYVQRWCGYVCTGMVTDHVFPVWWGCGRNGKGTIIKVLRAVMGDYACAGAQELVEKGHYGKTHTEIFALLGKRLVVVSETGNNCTLNEPQVKRLTGGDSLTARAMYKDLISWDPTHKLVLLTNDKPSIHGTDIAIWARVHLTPFLESFVGDRANVGLYQELEQELEGVLAWMVRGCLEWQKGLRPPDTVVAATLEYKSDQDRIGLFLRDRCVMGSAEPGKGFAWASKGEVFYAYQDWCKDSGFLGKLGKIKFNAQFAKRDGIEEGRHPKTKNRGWVGVRLLDINKLADMG